MLEGCCTRAVNVLAGRRRGKPLPAVQPGRAVLLGCMRMRRNGEGGWRQPQRRMAESGGGGRPAAARTYRAERANNDEEPVQAVGGAAWGRMESCMARGACGNGPSPWLHAGCVVAGGCALHAGGARHCAQR